jgi:pimeloyl-ACP methyl ester carboxylesterase
MRGILTAVAAVLAACTLAPSARAQSDVSGYCEPENAQYDPRDTERDTPPTPLPPGFTRRDFTIGGLSSPLTEAGSPASREAIVFMHGNSGSSLDFAGILRAAPPGARVLAFDLYGFGEADKPWDFSYSLEDSMPLLTQAAAKLGIDRIHLVGHDIGGVLGIEWASLHPSFLASATMLSSGVLIGYEDHDYARIWRRPGEGEAFMAATTRSLFHQGINSKEPEPLPDEFLDRDYDFYDRATRCAVLKATRAEPDVSGLAKRQAERLKPYDRPALVIWGGQDAFIKPEIAQRQREAFPHARIEVFEGSGHWPFVNEEDRTVKLLRAFFMRHVLERKGVRIRASARRRGRRVLVRAWLRAKPRRFLANATVRVAGHRAMTGAAGRARLRVERGHRLRVRISKAPLRPAAVRIAP